MSKKHIRTRQKQKEKQIAKDHILELFEIAKKEPNHVIAKNSIVLAQKYSTKYKVPIPRELKRTYCKTCYQILIPGKTATVRLKAGKSPQRIITCKSCETIKRIGYTKK